jgi:hypothetical protein
MAKEGGGDCDGRQTGENNEGDDASIGYRHLVRFGYAVSNQIGELYYDDLV